MAACLAGEEALAICFLPGSGFTNDPQISVGEVGDFY